MKMATGRMKTLLTALVFTASTALGSGSVSSKIQTKAEEKISNAQIALRLKDKTLVEKKMENKQQLDSLKNGVKKVDVSDGVFITAPKGANVIKVKKDEIKDADNTIFTYPMRLDGMQIITAKVYSSQQTIVRDFINNQLVSEFYSLGATDNRDAYINGVNVFPQSFDYTFRCNNVNYPQVVWVKMNYFYITDLPPISVNNVPQISPLIFAFLGNYGETPGVLFYCIDNPILPRTLGATKVLIISCSDYDENYVKLSVRSTPAIVKTIYEEDIVAPGNADRTVWGINTITRIFNVNGNNYSDSCRGANFGNYRLIANGHATEPDHPSMIASSVVIGITPISTQIPSAYSLSQNYPNPFNGQTKLKIDVPKAGLVGVKVYDALGREVAALVNETLAPGSYNVTWNASSLPSGPYFYRMNAGNGEFVETKKMLLVK